MHALRDFAELDDGARHARLHGAARISAARHFAACALAIARRPFRSIAK